MPIHLQGKAGPRARAEKNVNQAQITQINAEKEKF
jgi:hypothetical protein